MHRTLINNLVANSKGLFFMLLILTLATGVYAQDGKALFDANCKQCHAINDVVIGPALKNIEQKYSEEWLIKWIKGSQALVKAGDKDAVAIFNQFNKVVMPNQNLSDAEIKAVLAWITEESNKAPVAATPGGAAPGTAPEKSNNTLYWVLAIIIILLALSATLGKIKRGLEYALREKEGIPHPVPVEPKKARKIWIRSNKKLIAVILLILVVFGSVKGWYALKDIGVYTNYEPEQPIHFSHKLHAGDNKIACLYCHSGADKSRHANIPSASLCMNCHKYVKEGPVYGDQEIKKIYASLDWDGVKYGENQKPIQWIRVHSLPALAYFNHAQHVTAGKIECQTCHGPVQEMEVVKQFSPLTMGWCINCHRETEVKMDGNGYYDEVHKTLAAKYGADAKLTVDKIGGLECARCHY
jgi:cytochrome c551/c552